MRQSLLKMDKVKLRDDIKKDLDRMVEIRQEQQRVLDSLSSDEMDGGFLSDQERFDDSDFEPEPS